MRSIPGLYNNKVIHIKCGGIAYYYIGVIKSGDSPMSSKAMYPDGSQPNVSARHTCFSCKELIELSTSAIRQELRGANPDA